MIQNHSSAFASRFLLHTARCILLTCLVLITNHSLRITVFAQSATATLSGTVEDQNGAVIPGVSITLTNTANGQQRQATANDSGSFTVPLLSPGTYTLRAERQGFAPIETRNIVLNVNDQKSLQIQLKAGDINATVQITNEAPLINESPAVGTVVDRQFVANIPLNGRTFQSLISLSPGFVFRTTGVNSGDPGQFSVNGQRADANYFTVDGASANFGTTSSLQFNNTGSAGAQPALAVTGGTQSLVSVDALQEFRIQTSSYAPEFGRTPGAQVQITTRSGTNDFHGTIFDYLRNDVFDANDWFANANRQPKPPERQNDFGGTFSGPVLLPGFGEGADQPWYNGRNRTFFFFSYEGLRLIQPQTAVTQVHSVTVRQQASPLVQPYLNAFPVPNGPDLVNAQGQPTGFAQFAASYSDSITLDATSMRVDQSVGGRLTLFGRFNYSPSASINRTTGVAVNNLANSGATRSNTKTLTLGATYIITPRIANDLRFNYSTSESGAVFTQNNFGGATPLPDELLFPLFRPEEGALTNVVFAYNGVSDQIFVGSNSDGIQRQLNFVDSLSMNVDDHQLKIGVDFRQLSAEFLTNGSRIGIFFRDLAGVRNGIASQLSSSAMQTVRPHFTNLSLFVQDTWKTSRRMTLTYGLRWELNPPPREKSDNDALTLTNLDNPAAFAIAPRGTPIYRTTYTNFAPRFGVAYQLITRSGRELLLRGGVGRFYAMGNEAASRAYTGYPFGVSKNLVNAPLPFTTAQLTPPPFPSSITPPFAGSFSVFVPGLKLPETWQWNVSSSQSLGAKQTISASYVGAASRRLLRTNLYLNNSNFPSGVFVFSNGAKSDYHAFQAQYDRRLSSGLQALLSYTWGHSIDEVSSILNFLLERGSADFDVRHAFAGAVTYNIPRSRASSRALNMMLKDWSVDGIVHYQSATPVDLTAGSIFLPDGTLQSLRPDLVSGVALYIDDQQAPGGRRFNPAAFRQPPRGPNGQLLRQGNLGRNVLRGFPLSQVDVALRRQFNLSERLALQLRVESFNIFNHPNFGAPNNSIASGLFGRSTQMFGRSIGGLSPIYQAGGPRSFQFALRLSF